MGLIAIFPVIFCSLLMRIKGGGLAKYQPKSRILKILLGGKLLSTIGFGVLCYFMGLPPWQAILCGMGWLAGVSPSIGEDIDDLRHGKWLPAIMRGVWMGAMLAVTTWNPAFILSGATFPICYWLSDRIDPKDWKYGEYILGAVIGLTMVMHA